MKLFNNHLYVILTIKQKEKAEVVRLAEKHNLALVYPDEFLNEISDLSQICIDDEHLGGHLMSVTCAYEISYLRNKSYRLFKNVKEFKEYVRIADQRQEHYFITEKNSECYYKYVKSLSLDDLKNEYLLVKNIVDYTDSYYLATKDYIEKTLSNSIKRSISSKKDTLEAVYKQLNKIVKLRNELDDVINTNIYLINRDNCLKEQDAVCSAENDNVSRMRMRSFLKRTHFYFHSNERSGYFCLDIINKNLDTIFNIFNYKLKAEGTISYKHIVFETVRKLGYPEYLPNYLAGKKKDKKWDYISIFKRLLYTLKIYDCYPLLSNDLIPLAFKTREEVEVLANKLVSLKYKDKDDLINCTKHKYPPVAVIVESNKKTFRAGGGITVMACLCNSRRRKPLYISDLLEHFDKIIVNHDFVYHNLLLLKVTSDKSRFKPQILSLKEAEKIKNNSELKKLIDMVKKATKMNK
ncbi:MAG: hypothetical protein J5955_03320 [Bacilli bacterium]|nr:hypothetical protein [Bacilli bacterium]